VLRDGASLFTGQIISSAQANVDETGEWTVSVDCTGRVEESGTPSSALCYYQQYIAIILDDRVESAPQDPGPAVQRPGDHQWGRQRRLQQGAGGVARRRAKHWRSRRASPSSRTP